MKVVILAGGKGTRISEESKLKPKPMVSIDGKPILWHIMKHYASYGFNEFVICLGYKGNVIKDYFVDYYAKQKEIKCNLSSGNNELLNWKTEDWKVTLADTGIDTLTAGRIINVKKYIGNEPFMITYGDGVADINLEKLLILHNKNKKTLTISSTKPDGRFGALRIDERTNDVMGFKEKAREDQSIVNIGFMVAEPDIFDYLEDGSEMLEAGPFERIAEAGQMDTYYHSGFWSPMDTIRDREYLETVYRSGLYNLL